MSEQNEITPVDDYYHRLAKVLQKAGSPGDDFSRLETLYRKAKELDGAREMMRTYLAENEKLRGKAYAETSMVDMKNKRLEEAARKTLALTDYTLEEHGDLVPDGIVPDKYVMGRAAYDAINEAIDAAREAMGDAL